MSVAPDISYRTPSPPQPVECFDLAHPLVPPALDGLTILHVSDLHVRRNLLHTDRYRIILHALQQTPADLIVLTGDLMDEPGHERAALDTLAAMSAAWRPRVGVFGVFGNHDTPEFRRVAVRELAPINWIGGRAIDLPLGRPECKLRLLGLDWSEDALALLLTARPAPPGALAVALAHHPTSLIPAAEFKIPIILAGHTHAGQIRLHSRLAPHTSSDLPPHLASGVLKLRSTLCCISRGLGDGVIEGLRINCPRQIPLYTLRRRDLTATSENVTQVLAW